MGDDDDGKREYMICNGYKVRYTCVRHSDDVYKALICILTGIIRREEMKEEEKEEKLVDK